MKMLPTIPQEELIPLLVDISHTAMQLNQETRQALGYVIGEKGDLNESTWFMKQSFLIEQKFVELQQLYSAIQALNTSPPHKLENVS